MRSSGASIFAHWAPLYEAAGFWPRPIFPDTKACKLPNWQTPDGPVFVQGPFKVVGEDVYRLDADGDGIACEPLH